MPNLMKIGLLVVVPLAVVVGVGYGLAKVGKIPVPKNPILSAIGLNPKVTPVASNLPKPPTPEENAAKVMAEQQLQFTKEREEWVQQQKSKQAAEERAKLAIANAAPDPKETARMASVYEQMPIDAVTKIFALLPDDRILALMRKMDEKKVGEILSAQKPDRAARFTLALSRAQTPPQTASAN
ncbi:MAG: hypothetical protein H7308_19865 [Chthonomonadaceae bacterium]|nr:hypothetical protein [Chthonomonadaceae bacterium]